MENFRIESLEINKIGAFEHIKMDFPVKKDEYAHLAEIHILTGENGTGKTTILMLLASIADRSNDESIFKRIHNFKNLIRASSSTDYLIKIDILGGKNLFHKWFAPLGKEISPIVLNRIQDFGSNYNNNFVIDCACFAYSGNRYTHSEYINESEYIVGNPFENAVNFSKLTDSKQFLIWILSNKTKSLIAFSNGDNEAQTLYTDKIKRVETTISEIIGTNIQFVLQDKPNVHVAIKMNDIIMDIDVLPDGIKSMISWIGDLILRLENILWKENNLPIFDRNFILFLDEIEVHLHPAWQRKILPVVQKLFKNAQIFISTHSPFVVGSVDGAWVHKLKKDGAYAVLDGEPILSEDGKSVRRILDETFGINEQYGVEVEKDLEKFREFRQKIMMGYEYNAAEFKQLVTHLASQSAELDNMMGMEMNQLKRITQKELV
jgi:predicted ATP-binding protein involved in virulence